MNFPKLKIKQFLKQVNLRKTSLTNLITNIIQKSNINFKTKKHLRNDTNIEKLTLFLAKK